MAPYILGAHGLMLVLLKQGPNGTIIMIFILLDTPSKVRFKGGFIIVTSQNVAAYGMALDRSSNHLPVLSSRDGA